MVELAKRGLLFSGSSRPTTGTVYAQARVACAVVLHPLQRPDYLALNPNSNPKCPLAAASIAFASSLNALVSSSNAVPTSLFLRR